MKKILGKLIVTTIVVLIILISSSQAVTYAYNIYVKQTRFNSNKYYMDGTLVYDYALNNSSVNDYYCLRGGIRVSEDNKNYGTYEGKISLGGLTNISSYPTVLKGVFRSESFPGGSWSERESTLALYWLADNMYTISSSNSTTEKTIMKNNLNTIISKYANTGYTGQTVNDLPDELISVIQQFVIWQFVNPNDNNKAYYRNSIKGESSLKNIYWINSNGKTTYCNDTQAKKGYALYTALYHGAFYNVKGTKEYTMGVLNDVNNAIVQVNTKSNSVVAVDGKTNTYRIGPISLTVKNASMLDSIQSSTLTAKGTTVNSKKYVKLNSSEDVATASSTEITKKIDDLVNKNQFYIEFVTSSELGANSTVNFKVNSKTKTYISSQECNVYCKEGRQPILEIKKDVAQSTKSSDTNFKYQPAEINFDLALTKQIAQIYRYDINEKKYLRVYDSEVKNKEEDKNLNDDRSDNIVYGIRMHYYTDANYLGENDTNKIRDTAVYQMNKEPITVLPGDIVRYKITVYNEGNVDAFVNEITDYIPKELELLKSTKDSYWGRANYEHGSDINEDTTNTDYNKVTINTKRTVLEKHEKNSKELNSFDTYLECKVKTDAIGGDILTNVSEISKYGYVKNGVDTEATKTGIENDSVQNNVFANINNIEKYRENVSSKIEENGLLVNFMNKTRVTEEDDEDFEQVKVARFDLALRKFISSVNGKDLSDDNPREPVVNSASIEQYKEDGRVAYYHTKAPVNVKVGDKVVYTIRIYNEGSMEGYAKEIIDYLPVGLKLAENSDVNSTYNWNETLNSDGTRTVTTKALENDAIVPAYEESGLKKLATEGEEYFIGENESKKFWKDIQIECEVVALTRQDIEKNKEKILTNVAEISSYGYNVVNSNDAGDVDLQNSIVFKYANDADNADIDSKENNVISNFKGSGETVTKGYYDLQSESHDIDNFEDTLYFGLEDDDDFENLKLEGFDLALRKFITKVGEQNIDGEDSREPNLNKNPSSYRALLYYGTAWYYHPKAPVKVNTNDTVLYTIRVYNEGYIDGYANEITDYLPEGLEFIANSQINIDNGWKIEKNSDGSIKKNSDGSTTITTEVLAGKEIKASNGSEGYEKVYNKKLEDKDIFWRDIQVECKVTSVINGEVLTNVSEITKYGYNDEDGKFIEANSNNVDQDSEEDNVFTKNTKVNNIQNYYKYQYLNKGVEQQHYAGRQDDDDFENIEVEVNKIQEFDLALRKFITSVTTGVGTNNEKKLDVPDRVPVFKVDENGNYVYEHSKEPVMVANQNIVEYTIRVYNEGSLDGYASKIKDDIPEGLEFVQDDEINKKYGWILLDEEGNETNDVNKAKYIVTDYLSKDKEKIDGENLLKAFDKEGYEAGSIKEPEYKEVKIAFKVIMPNTEDKIIINKAQISDDTDKDGNDVVDKDSTPDVWNEGEDDQDIEKIKVQCFDLSLRKWVTKAIVIEDGKEIVTETGHTAEDNPERVVKVDLQKSKLDKVVVKFEYNIRVKNEGEIAGFVKEISDYVPEGLRFEAADNPLWEESEGKVITNQLKDTLLQPGETAEVSVVLTWINRIDNMGLKVNVAEISKDYNEYGSPDIDSTPNNQVPGEDDIDDAPVMLTVKTGEEIFIFVGMTMTVLAMLGIGIVTIERYVLK